MEDKNYEMKHQEKHADNTINEKNKLNQIEKRIDEQQMKIKKIDSMQNDLFTMKKSFNNCLSLLSKSIKGKKSNYMFADMYDSNNAITTKVSSILDEERSSTNKILNDLYLEKAEIESKQKKEQKED